MNPNKSPGPDKIYSRVLKELHEELTEPLTIIFKKSLQEGILPGNWKHSVVTAIFKKGDKSSPNNYRPVSLTSVVCKIMESLVRDAIQHHMESNSLYTHCQHGFRRGRSCVSQLLEVMEDFTNFVENGESFDTIYLDFRKAFDTVPHARLMCKLRAYGVDGKVANWVHNFLSNRTQQVRVGNNFSKCSPVTSGIPQGSVLGPILFTIFINDLPEGLESICKIFADDTKIYNASKHCVSEQNDLNKVLAWSEKWQLYFNTDKCTCIYYGRNNPKNEYYFFEDLTSSKLKEGEQEKDLGIIFDPTLKFDIHINTQVDKANKILGTIRRNFSFIDNCIFNHLYKALVRPHLEYGQAVWSPRLIRQSKVIENVQRRATKLVPTIKHLSYEDRLRELNLPSMKYRRLRGDMILVYELLKEGESSSSRYFFKFLRYYLH